MAFYFLERGFFFSFQIIVKLQYSLYKAMEGKKFNLFTLFWLQGGVEGKRNVVILVSRVVLISVINIFVILQPVSNS